MRKLHLLDGGVVQSLARDEMLKGKAVPDRGLRQISPAMPGAGSSSLVDPDRPDG